MAKGGSTGQQIAQLMHLLGAITFIIAIIYGLYVATRDPDTWGNAEQLAVVRVVILFLVGISFFLIALLYKRSGKTGKDKGNCGTGGHGGHGGRGYQSPSLYGNAQNAFTDDISSSADE